MGDDWSVDDMCSHSIEVEDYLIDTMTEDGKDEKKDKDKKKKGKKDTAPEKKSDKVPKKKEKK